MAGRKPKPTALKELEGNPGKRKLNKKEPIPGKGMPDCPKWLLPEAKEEWKRLCQKLSEMGVLTEVDMAAFAAYCQSYASVYANWYNAVYMPSDISGANVNLSALTIGSISLDPTFAAGTTEYTAETSNSTNTITATAVDENAGVAITVNGNSISSGSSATRNEGSATWNEGENLVVVTVTNSGSSKRYTVTVTKEE